MTSAGYAHFAEALVFVHGPRALREAALHAELCEKSGDMETAERWRKAMRAMIDRNAGKTCRAA